MNSKHLLTVSVLLAPQGCSWGTGDVDPCDESSGAGGFCCKQDECASYGSGITPAEYDELVASCNFVTIREQNLIDGNPPYETTEACRDTLSALINLGPVLEASEGIRETVLNSIHYLFFHPLAGPANGILFEDTEYGTELAAPQPQLISEQIGSMPDDWDIVMTKTTANTAIIHYWFDNISRIEFADVVADWATASYWNGTIVAYNQFAAHANRPRSGAATLYHELAHVRSPWHVDCTMAYGEFPEIPSYIHEQCDLAGGYGSYPNGGALMWAMAVGGLAAHPEGVSERVLDIDHRFIAGTTYTRGAAYRACQALVGRAVGQFRILYEVDVSYLDFCHTVEDYALDAWEAALPADAYGVESGSAAMEIGECAPPISQLTSPTISIVGNTVTIPKSAADASFADIDTTLAGSWTAPVTVYDAIGAPSEAAEIQNLRPTSILAHIGLEVGDRITHVDGISIADTDALLRNFAHPEQVTQLEVTLLRGSSVISLVLQIDPAL